MQSWFPGANISNDTKKCLACRHLKALFFANLSNQFMWYAYLKAAWRGLTTTLLSRWFGKLTFKATAKGATKCPFVVLAWFTFPSQHVRPKFGDAGTSAGV